MNSPLKIILAFLVAVLVAGLLGSIFQTQVNLAAMRDIGPPISFSMRWQNTLGDLIHFAPIYLGLVFGTFLVAFAVAELIARFIPGHRMFWLALGAVVGLWLCFEIVNLVAPMPTYIAATRSLGGTLILLLAAAIGAVVYSIMTAHLNAPEDDEEVEA